MVLFNYSTKELTAKIVYYGPGLCGKTTNLQWIHEKLPIKNKGKMLSLATETDRTLFFDFLPIELGTIRGMKTRVQLYTVPGQVFYNATRRMVLKGADCVVFVVDSQEPMLDANLESWENMRQNLEANEIKTDEIPVVLQYNKRDLPNALPLEILNERLNPDTRRPFHEAVAVKGIGVEECLKTATALVFRSLATRYGTPAESAAAPPPPSGGTAPIPSLPERPAAAPVPTPSRAAPPAEAKAPPRPAARESGTLPPVATAAEGQDDVLSGLELQAASDAVLEDELALEEEEMSPALARPHPRDTVATPPGEAEDIRRRVRGPRFEPEMAFEAIEDEEEGIEELTLDSASEATLQERAAGLLGAAEPSRAARDISLTLDFEGDSEEEGEQRATPARPIPARRPDVARPEMEMARPGDQPITARAVVTLPKGAPPEATIDVPVDLTLAGGVGQLHVNLRLTLNLKIKD